MALDTAGKFLRYVQACELEWGCRLIVRAVLHLQLAAGDQTTILGQVLVFRTIIQKVHDQLGTSPPPPELQ